MPIMSCENPIRMQNNFWNAGGWPLSRAGLAAVHDASMRVLAETGVVFAAPEAIAIFKRHGFRVDGNRVYFTESQVRKALDTVPPRFTILARNPRHHIEMGPETVSFGLGRSAIIMVEPDGAHRPGTMADHIACAKLCQSMDVLEHWGPLVFPCEVPSVNAQLWMARTMILYLDKPYNYINRDDIDLVALAHGTTREKMAADAGDGRSFGQSTVTLLSPLTFSEESCRNLIAFVECGIAFHIGAMPIAGTTGPCSTAGILVQQNCENLAPIVLSQLIRPGCPVFYGAIGSHADMRTMGTVFGSAEARIIERGGSQLARFYGLLCRGNAGLTDALPCDFQAGAEAMLHMINVVKDGPHFLTGAGLLGSYMGAALGKIVLDAELIAYARRYITPVDPDPETLASDVINAVGPGGQFVTHPHTLKQCRTAFSTTEVFNRKPYDRWAVEGKKDAWRLAHEKALKIIASYRRPPIDAGLEQEIDAYVRRHWTGPGVPEL